MKTLQYVCGYSAVILVKSIPIRAICLAALFLPSALATSLADKCRFEIWTVPAMPGGVRPTRCLLSVATTPGGDVFFTGCDGKTNSALYKYSPTEHTLVYVGDARSASRNAGNWQNGETAEKIHIRPILYRGDIFVATADYMAIDDGYSKRRGFHWYSYQAKTDKFVDLSTQEPGGVAGAHASIAAATLDEEHGMIYAVDSPRGLLFRFDVKHGKTELLSRHPQIQETLCMPGRAIWVSRSGRVYMTFSTLGCVAYYDPQTGWGMKQDWSLAKAPDGTRVFRTWANSRDGRFLYLADADGRIYRYDRELDSLNHIGQCSTTEARYATAEGNVMLRALNVSADGKRLYFINDEASCSALWQWTISSGVTERLCNLGELDPRLERNAFDVHAGNDSRGADGRLYVCAFGSNAERPTELLLYCLNPEALRH